jgi:hypothetical protein
MNALEIASVGCVLRTFPSGKLFGDFLVIYNGVHDNIQFIPTYGSLQSSQMTLETKSGNAMDTASLLIALLRADGNSRTLCVWHSAYTH